MTQQKVKVEEVAESARRIIIRLAIGDFTTYGPRDNIISVESLVAFTTTVNELYREGYQMVPPEDYASACGITLDQACDRIRNDGTLFLLLYEGEGGSHETVPLEERNVSDDLGPHLV